MARPLAAALLLLAPALLAGCTGDPAEACTPADARLGGDPLCFRADGWTLQGEVLRAGPDAPAAILVHGLNEGRGSYGDLARELNGSGVTVLAYDLRGHGASTTYLGEHRTADDIGPSEFIGLPRGVAAAREALDTGEAPLAIVGASVGANAALVHADRVGGVDALALLSPGLEYVEIEAKPSAEGYEGALYMAASEGDDYAQSSVRELANASASSNVTVDVVDGEAHGTQLLDGPVGDRVANWTVAGLEGG